MKKLLAILLLAVMALGMCACGKKEDSGVKQFAYDYEDTPIFESDNSIELTTSNIEDYLKIELSDTFIDYSRYPGNYGYYSIADLVVDIYPISSGSFENVRISLELTAPDEWGFCDEEYSVKETYPQTQNIDMVLRVNGEGTGSQQIVTQDLHNSPIRNVSTTYSYQITSVSGTLVKD